MLYFRVAFWLGLSLWLHFNLPLTPWLSSSLFFLFFFFFFLIILRSVPAPPFSFLFHIFSFSLISTMLLSLFLFFLSFLFILFLSLDVPRRFDVWMKEKSVPVVDLLLYKINQIFLSFKRSNIKRRPIANFNILKESDQFVVFDLLQ